jgi:hypothetical protein
MKLVFIFIYLKKRRITDMQNTEITIKRQSTSLMYLTPFLFIIYPFIHNPLFGEIFTIENFPVLILYAVLATIASFVMFDYLRFQLTIKQQQLIVNKVSSVSFKDIQKAYIGTLSYLISIEERDELPLSTFKDERIAHLFKEKENKKKGNDYATGVFLVLRAKYQLYFIQADFFSKEDFDKLVGIVKEKGVEVENQFTVTEDSISKEETVSMNESQENSLEYIESKKTGIQDRHLQGDTDMNVLYKGLFIENDSSLSLIKSEGAKRLAVDIQDKHVTFEFKPSDLFPEHFLGPLFFMKVVGYANDGKNSGFKVQLPSVLAPYYKGANTIHITSSISLEGKAKDTAHLTFEPIEPFNISGRLGYFTNKGVVLQTPEATIF